MRMETLVVMTMGSLLALTPDDLSAQKKQRDKITRQEIESSSQRDRDLLTAIRALRPHFLEGPRGVRTLGGGMQNPTLVVVNGRRETGADALFRIMASYVEEVRYLDPARAQNEYGVNANGGAIVVKLIDTKQAGDPPKPPR